MKRRRGKGKKTIMQEEKERAAGAPIPVADGQIPLIPPAPAEDPPPGVPIDNHSVGGYEVTEIEAAQLVDPAAAPETVAEPPAPAPQVPPGERAEIHPLIIAGAFVVLCLVVGLAAAGYFALNRDLRAMRERCDGLDDPPAQVPAPEVEQVEP